MPQDLFIPHPTFESMLHYERVQRIQLRYMRGEFLGAAGNDAITELLAIVEDQWSDRARDKELTALRTQGTYHREYIKSLEALITPPDCRDCNSEMSLNAEQGHYYCTCLGGCTCHQSAPCSHCMQFVDLGDWVDNRCDYQEATGDDEENQRTNARALLESGPSAVATAEPVTPRYVIACQGDSWDGVENL